MLIVGAGISGIGMGHYLVNNLPGKTFAIVDGRDTIGGTWDLFGPGIRSDSTCTPSATSSNRGRRTTPSPTAHEIMDYLYEVIDEDSPPAGCTWNTR